MKEFGIIPHALNYIELPYIALRYNKLRCITVHYFAPQDTAQRRDPTGFTPSDSEVYLSGCKLTVYSLCTYAQVHSTEQARRESYRLHHQQLSHNSNPWAPSIYNDPFLHLIPSSAGRSPVQESPHNATPCLDFMWNVRGLATAQEICKLEQPRSSVRHQYN